MPRARAEAEEEGEQTNGRNGASVQHVPDPLPSAVEAHPDSVRRLIGMLLVAGSTTEAQTLFLAQPGTSMEGWNYLNRLTEPIRRYVLEGEAPYLRLVSVTQHEGVRTPEGDCAEDALPFEARNPDRARAEREWFEKKNGA